MLEPIQTWLDSGPGLCASFGFTLYLVFVVWRKLAARWVNWFPLVAKLVRFTLYAAAVGVGILGIQALAHDLLAWPNNLFALAGAALPPAINTLASRLRPREKVRRGARIAEPADVNREVARALPSADLKDTFQIGGVTIPRSAETYHFLVAGSTGSGKSVLINQLLDFLEERGDLALVVDSGGEFCSRLFRPGRDHILNPFDDRCMPWSPTAEMAGPWDAEALAKSMVPDGVGESKDWNAYAQTFVTSVLRKLTELNKLSIKDLLYYVQAASINELQTFLVGTSALAQLASDRTFGSIRTIATTYLSAYSYLSDHNNPVSIAKFIQAGRPGFLFLTYRDDQLDSLRHLISCALDVAARTILSQSPDRNRRVWLIIDEFASIGKVQSIQAVATKARKAGGCLLLSLQSISQLQATYGEKDAQSILSCLSSWLVLRCSDPETSESISKFIGDTEVSRMTRGESSSESGGSASLNEQIQTQRAVMPIELQSLANCTGFFKLAGNYPICQVKLEFPRKRKPAAEAYAQRDFIAKPMLMLQAAPVATENPAPVPAGIENQAKTSSPEAASSGQAAPTEQETTYADGPVVIAMESSPYDSGPEALEESLNNLADLYENGL